MSESYLIFRADQRLMALPTRQTRQVFALQHVTTLPGTGGSLRGIMPAAGRAVPVVNFSQFTGLAAQDGTDIQDTPTRTSALALLCETGGESLILPVQDVVGSVDEDAASTASANDALLQPVWLGEHEVLLLNLEILAQQLGAQLKPA